ncbi:MAG: ABC transporter permease [Acidimicrobiaceae bacterium]|nr:ABC transporter permease [Acidimicrobiaceae bacterium]
MTRFILRRVAAMLVVLAVLLAVMFGLQHFTPADPVTAAIGRGASPAIIAHLRHQLGYDRPLPVQFINYVGKVLRGNLGASLVTHDQIRSDLAKTVPASVELVLAAFVVAIVGAVVLSMVAASPRRIARAVRVALLAGASTPVFLTSLVLVIVFYHNLHLLPATGQTSLHNAPTGPTRLLLLDSLLHGDTASFLNALQHLILPAACLAATPMVAIGRVLASAIESQSRSDYVRTARSKGLGYWRVLFKHTMRNCLNGALAMTGLQVGAMFGGIVVVENVFAWPGLGNFTANAISTDDFPAILGTVLVVGTVYVVANMIVDALQAWADPRIVLG